MKNLFEAGTTYQVSKDLKIGADSLVAGDILTFVNGGYSPYDDCYIYEFKDGLSKTKVLVLPIDNADALLEDIEKAFVKVN